MDAKCARSLSPQNDEGCVGVFVFVLFNQLLNEGSSWFLPHVGRSSDVLFALRLSQWKSPRVFLSQWGAFCHGRCPMPNLPRHVLPNFALGFCKCWQNLANDTWRKMARPHDICKLCSKIPVAFSCIFKCIKSHVCSLIQRSLFEIPMHCHSPC